MNLIKLILISILSLASIHARAYQESSETYSIHLPNDIAAKEVITTLKRHLSHTFYKSESNFTYKLMKQLLITATVDFDGQDIITAVRNYDDYALMYVDMTYKKNGRIKHTDIKQKLSIGKSSQMITLNLENQFSLFFGGLINLSQRNPETARVVLDSLKAQIYEKNGQLYLNLTLRVYGKPGSSKLKREIDHYYHAINATAEDLIYPFMRKS